MNGPGVETTRSVQETNRQVGSRERDTPHECCGEPMEPQLARAHDRMGQTVFVAIWRCSKCGSWLRPVGG